LKSDANENFRSPDAARSGALQSRGRSQQDFVMRGLDPRIHPSLEDFCEEDRLPGQARQ
jgi:hypothetical protein